MTVNLKMFYKASESFGITPTKECTKNWSKLKFFVCYILVVICIVGCLILSTLSLRLSYLASESVLELRDEVIKLRVILHNHCIRDMEEAMMHSFNDDYLQDAQQPTNFISAPENNVVIGVVKLAKEENGGDINTQSTLYQELLKDKIDKLKIEQSVKKKRSTSSLPSEIERESNMKIIKHENYFTKRSINNNPFQLPPVQKLPESDIRDSVEEFSVLPEVSTLKTSSHPKRNKHRLRHNIETLDERGSAGKKKILPAIHYDGDSSGYVVGKHTNYNGNGHLSHPSQIYSDWAEVEWGKTFGMNDYFQMDKGLVKVKDGGLYLVYVQIYYLDDHDTNGYRVYKNDDILLQCTTMTHSAEKVIKGNTCYTSRLDYFKENDIITIRDLANSRYTIFEAGKSFFGMAKLK